MKLIHRIIFFDENEDDIKYYQKIIGKTDLINFKCGKFEDLIKKDKIDILIIPTDINLKILGCYFITPQIFPNIEEKLQNKIVEKNSIGSNIKHKNILPIGKTIICETNNKLCPFVITSPIISSLLSIKLKNIYLCIQSIIKKLFLINVPVTVACPCLIPRLISADKTAKQIKKALLEVEYTISKNINNQLSNKN